MAVTNFSPLLGLALPTTGDLSGTWGTVVNNSITDLLDSAVAGTTTLSADTDVTLTTTSGAANQARNAVLLWTASNSVTRYVTAPAQSKAYIVINAGTGAIVVRGSGPTTGVTIASGEKSAVAWNGSDFVKVSGVASVSVASANGFAGTSSGGSTPALTLSTSVSGMVKGNGTAISAATAGTDYVAPGGALGTPSSGTLSNCTVDGTDSVGFLSIPQNAQTGSYTLVLADAGKHIYHASGAGAATYTIPANGSVAYPIGTAITFVNMSATTISIAINSDSMYLSASGATGTRSLYQYGSATALKIAATTWLISGSGLL